MGSRGIKAFVLRNQRGGKLRQTGRVFRLPVCEKGTVLGKVINVVHGVDPYHIPLGIALLRLDSGHGLRSVAGHHLHLIACGLLKEVADDCFKVVQIDQQRLRLWALSGAWTVVSVSAACADVLSVPAWDAESAAVSAEQAVIPAARQAQKHKATIFFLILRFLL